MKPLSELIADVETSLERRWARSCSTASNNRRSEVAEAAGKILPALMLAPRGAMVLRVHDEKLLRASTSWAWGEGNMLFMGMTGIGKSTAAALLVRRLIAEEAERGQIEKASRICFASARELTADKRAHPYGKGEPQSVDRAMHAPLLVLDDVNTDSDGELMLAILDERYNRSLPTVLTTTMGVFDRDQYGNRTDVRVSTTPLATHVTERGYHRFLNCGGKSARIVKSVKTVTGTKPDHV